MAECWYLDSGPADCRPKSKRQYAALFRDKGHIEVHYNAVPRQRPPKGESSVFQYGSPVQVQWSHALAWMDCYHTKKSQRS